MDIARINNLENTYVSAMDRYGHARLAKWMDRIVTDVYRHKGASNVVQKWTLNDF